MILVEILADHSRFSSNFRANLTARTPNSTPEPFQCGTVLRIQSIFIYPHGHELHHLFIYNV